MEAVQARGVQLQDGLKGSLQAVAARCVDTAFTPGSRPARGTRTKLAALARNEGLICGTAGDNVLRLAPPLVISAQEVDELLRRLGRRWLPGQLDGKHRNTIVRPSRVFPIDH